MSVFDYCCPVWVNVSNSELSKVKNIKKRAARIILKRSNGNSAVSLFNDLKWLFDNRLNYHIGVMTYKTSIFSEKISPANDGLFVIDGLFVHEGLYVNVQLT